MNLKPKRILVAVEVGKKKTFASALDWPGWVRWGRAAKPAVDWLMDYSSRYKPVAGLAGFKLPDVLEVDIVETLEGGSGTDFGVPSRIHTAESLPLDAEEAMRRSQLVAAAWSTFDLVAAKAPAELRKGPRGGGRNRDKIVSHVNESDGYYARELGLKLRQPDPLDRTAIEAMRAAMLDVLRQPSDGTPLAGRKWTQRYAARRIAWHALDHTWEIEDRSEKE